MHRANYYVTLFDLICEDTVRKHLCWRSINRHAVSVCIIFSDGVLRSSHLLSEFSLSRMLIFFFFGVFDSSVEDKDERLLNLVLTGSGVSETARLFFA